MGVETLKGVPRVRRKESGDRVPASLCLLLLSWSAAVRPCLWYDAEASVRPISTDLSPTSSFLQAS